MKTKKVIIAAAMLLACTAVSAQGKADEWQSVYAQYNSSKLDNWDFESRNGISLNGFTIGVNKAFNVSSNWPLFVEAGAAFSGAYWSDEDYTIKLYSIKVPVNLVYKWDVVSNISVLPFIGVYAKYNISGKFDEDFYEEGVYGVNLFNDKEMDDEWSMEAWKRFQLGWQIGANVRFLERFYAGLSYGSDFSNISNYHNHSCKLSTFSVTAGFNF